MRASTVRPRPRVVILESDPVQAARSRAFLEALGCEVMGSAAYVGDAGGFPTVLEVTALDAVSPDAVSPDAVSPDAVSPDAVSPASPKAPCSCRCEPRCVPRSEHGAFGVSRGVATRPAQLDTESWVAASIAHDLNNAITAMRAQLYVAHARLGSALPVAECQQILDHCTTLAKRLLASAMPRERASRAAPPKVDLRRCVTDALRIVSPVLPSNIVVRPALGSVPSFVCFHPELIVDAVVNLVFNARDAMPNGGNIGVSIAPFVGAYHQLTVVDSGVGMAPETLTSAFEPFFTTKGRERGTGLGLPAVRRTIEEAGGTVTITSKEGKGTQVTILLPRAAPGGLDDDRV